MNKIITIIAIIILVGCKKEEKYPDNFTKDLPFGLKYHITETETRAILHLFNIDKINKGENDFIYYNYQLKDGYKNEIKVENYFKNDSLYEIRVVVSNEFYDKELENENQKKMAIDFLKDQKINLNSYNYSENRESNYVWKSKNNLNKIVLNLLGTLDIYFLKFNDSIITKTLEKEWDERNNEQVERVRQKYDNGKVVVVENSFSDNSVRQVEKYLKSTLKDSDSYEGISWNKVIESDNGYSVRHKYRAKNSLGGYVIEDQIFYLDFKGIVISVQ